MNRFTRMLMTTGLGLVASVTAAGPALAASGTDQASSRPESGANQQWRHDRDRVVGFFRSWRICERAGDYGEDEGWWDDHDCVPIRTGHFRTRIALVVDYDDWGSGWNGHWGVGWVGNWTPW